MGVRFIAARYRRRHPGIEFPNKPIAIDHGGHAVLAGALDSALPRCGSRPAEDHEIHATHVPGNSLQFLRGFGALLDRAKFANYRANEADEKR